jgi:alkanesulfonate monooxygenase SsuD/methylene tetrahydromethanopterin reductase-like flavin-dependent oxidoreductase (luciferase family)
MRFGIFGAAQAGSPRPGTPMGQGFHDFIDFNIEAEALGYHSTFLVEHHFTGWNQVSATLTLLTWLAARTTTLRLGTAVTVLPWHNPVLLAEQAATLDLLSEGRLDFGVGKGYRYNEFTGFAIPLDEADARFEEALAIITKAWTSGQRFSHHGRFWTFNDILVEPPTSQKPHPPFWMAAGTPSSIRRVAERGQAAPRPVRSVRRHRRAHYHIQGRARGERACLQSNGDCPCARHACRQQPGRQGRRPRTQSPVP